MKRWENNIQIRYRPRALFSLDCLEGPGRFSVSIRWTTDKFGLHVDQLVHAGWLTPPHHAKNLGYDGDVLERLVVQWNELLDKAKRGT